MFPGSIHIAQIHANERRHDFMVEAEHARLANEALGLRRRANLAGSLRNLRHRIGVAMVAAGHRMQHSGAQPAPDRAPLGGLRAAR